MSGLLVVGGGMAGITVANALQSRGHTPTWIESKAQAGGALHRVHNPLYGWPEGNGQTGWALAQQLEAGVRCATLQRGVCLLSVERFEQGWKTRWQRGSSGRLESCDWRAIVLCTGTQPRAWDASGASGLWGRGVELSTHARGESYRGDAVAVVGGGDAAVEGALRLAAMGCTVWLLVRGAQLAASPRFANQATSHPAISIRYRSEVIEVAAGASDKLESIALNDGSRLAVRGLFVRVGVAPCVPPISPKPRCDEGGYLVVDSLGRSSLDGLYGAGEVTSPEVSQLAAVVEQAERVALAIVSR